MRDFLKRLNLSAIATALCAGALVLGASAGAQARDDHWDHRHDRYDRHGHYDHGRNYHHDRPVVVDRRPVVVDRRPVIVDRRPVVVAPPVYQAVPAYQAPSGLNLNFNIPLQ